MYSGRLGSHDDIIRWKWFLSYWPFVWSIHQSPVNSPHKGQWCRALMFYLICAWTNSWVNNLRCHHAHHDVTVMSQQKFYKSLSHFVQAAALVGSSPSGGQTVKEIANTRHTKVEPSHRSWPCLRHLLSIGIIYGWFRIEVGFWFTQKVLSERSHFLSACWVWVSLWDEDLIWHCRGCPDVSVWIGPGWKGGQGTCGWKQLPGFIWKTAVLLVDCSRLVWDQ